MRKFSACVLLTGSLSAILISFVFLYFNMIGLEPAFYKAFFTDLVSFSVVPQLLVVAFLVSVVMVLKRDTLAGKLAKALLPGWLLWGILAFPLCFSSILIFIFLFMVCFWRSALVCGWSLPAVRNRFTMPVVIGCSALAGCVWGIYMQFESYDRLWFTFTDWTEYYTGYIAIAGDPLNPLRWLYNAGHFNPLPNLLLTPILALFPHPRTLFILNSILIYLIVPLWYLLARELGMRRFPAGLLAVLLMFHFTIPNLNLSLFYGFHPIVMFPAILLAFYYFYRRGNRAGCIVMFVLSLLLQETTTVFWCGWAFCLLLKRKYWQGILLGLFSCAWFAFTVKVVSPAVKKMLYNMPDSWNSNYVQTFHYGEIGNSISEILLAPLTKTAVFFEQFASPLNFYFIAVLLLGFFPLALAEPLLLATALPLLAGLFLMGGSDALNISMWYQTEIFAILTLATAAGYWCFLRRRRSFSGLFLAGVPEGSRHRRAAHAAVFAVAAGLLFCGLFFGRLPVGKYAFSRIQERPDCTEIITRVKELVPPDQRILTTGQMLMHFLDRPAGHIMHAAPPFHAPYLLLYLDDLHVDFERNSALFEMLRNDRRYKLIFEHREKGCNVELYRKVL